MNQYNIHQKIITSNINVNNFLDDPVVGIRKPKNCVRVCTYHFGLNIKGIQILREIKTMINMEMEDIKCSKVLLIMYILELEDDDKKSI